MTAEVVGQLCQQRNSGILPESKNSETPIITAKGFAST
jgi:hypothetical protein